MAGFAATAGIAWRRCKEVGVPGSRVFLPSSSLSLTPTSPVQTEKVLIRWNLILEEAVEALGGTKPMYTGQRVDGFVQSRVRFRMPLDGALTKFENVDVLGMRFLEPWEAESSAAALALSSLERAPFHTRIIDVSRLRCEEMEKTCERYLLKAGEVYRGAKIFLLDWQDVMGKVEVYYKSLYESVVEDARRGAERAYGEIKAAIGNELYELNRTNSLKFKNLCSASEEIKAAELDVRARAEHHFRNRCHSRPENPRGQFARECRISMKIALHEMVSSLGWDEPGFKCSETGTEPYRCEVLILVNPGDGDVTRKTTVIAGGEGLSEDDAMESACLAALNMVEKELSICLADLNYGKRIDGNVFCLRSKSVR